MVFHDEKSGETDIVLSSNNTVNYSNHLQLSFPKVKNNSILENEIVMLAKYDGGLSIV